MASLEKLATTLFDICVTAQGHAFAQARPARRKRPPRLGLPRLRFAPRHRRMHAAAAAHRGASGAAAASLRDAPSPTFCFCPKRAEWRGALCRVPVADPRPSQVRWGATLSRLLRAKKRVLRLELPWRPVLAMLRETHLRECACSTRLVTLMRLLLTSLPPRSDGGYDGGAITSSHVGAVTSLARASRRFFPKGSAAEIWASLRPGLAAPHTGDAMHAAGWALLLLPVTHIGWDESVPWAALVADWAALLPAVPDCHFWASAWLTLLSHAAKHDVRGRADWAPVLPVVFTALLQSFELPIGGAQGAPPWRRPVPREVALLFGGETRSRGRCGAKLLVYRLGCDPSVGVQPQLDVLLDCLEHYAHPSNSGPWSGTLAAFLRASAAFLLKRLGAEGRGDVPAGSYGGALPPPAVAAFASGAMRLVSRAQFSRSHELAKAAAGTAAGLAYVAPQQALPLLVRRFEAALASMTATHQLVAALDCLALAVRPLLAAPPSALAAAAEADAALAPPAELVAAALRAALPGLDANDPPKTLATLRLFAATLSALPGTLGPGDDVALGGALDWADWADEALSRIFALLTALEPGRAGGGGGGDAPSGADGGGDDASSFLLYGSSMYRPFCELLLARLAPQLREAAMKRIARFAAATAQPGCAAELGELLTAATWADPAAAAGLLIRPAAAALRAEVAHVAAGAPAPPSPAAEALLRARAAALTSTLHCAGAAAADCRAVLEPAVAELWAVATSSASQTLWDAAHALLSALLSTLTSYFAMDQHAPERPARATSSSGDEDMADNHAAWQGHNVAAWLPSSPVGPPPGALPRGAALTWHEPGAAELAFARSLLETHAEAPAAALMAAASSPGGATALSRDALRGALMQMESCLGGARGAIPDFGADDEASCDDLATWAPESIEALMQRGAPYGLVAPLGPRGAARRGCRGRLAAAMQAAATSLARADDTETLLALLRGAEHCLNAGESEYDDFTAAAGAWRADAGSLTQPRAADSALTACDDDATGSSRRARRRPRWLAAEQASLTLNWRSSQAGYFRAGMAPALAAPYDATSPPGALLAAVALLASHRYKAVRDAAAPLLEAALKRGPAGVPAALAPFAAALADGSSDAAGAGEEAPLGAAAMLACRVCSRAAAGDAAWHATLLHALLRSAQHQGVRAQGAIQDLFLVLCFRFSRAAVAAAPRDPTTGALRGPLGDLRDELLASAASGDAPETPTHWRYVLMAHALVAMLSAPGGEGAEAGRLAAFFTAALRSDVAPLRPLAAAALLPLLRAEARSGAPGAAAAAARAALADASFVPLLCERLALNHVIAGEGGSGSGGGRGRSALLDAFAGGGEMMARSLAVSSAPREWPGSKYASGRGVFSALHASLFEALCRVDGDKLLPALRVPLEAAISGGDRGARALAAEALAGCARAGAAASPHWSEWMAPAMLRGALEAPAEARGDWVGAVTFACAAAGDHGATARAAVLAMLTAPSAAGAASGTQARRLLLLRAAVAMALDPTSLSPKDADAAAAAATSALAEAAALRKHASRAVREEAAAAAAMLCALAVPPAPLPSQAADVALPAPEPLALFEGAGGARGGDVALAAVRAALAPGAAAFCAGLDTAAAAAADAVLAAAPPALSNGANGGGENGGVNGGTAAMDVDAALAAAPLPSAAAAEATAWLESALLWVASCAANGDAASLAPALLSLLPALLRVQETPDPDFDHVARRALAYLKYVTLTSGDAERAAEAVRACCAGGAGSAWRARAAALSLLAPFALRHAFALPRPAAALLADAAEGRLGDARHEVRLLGAATLAGLLQGPAAFAAPSLRRKFAYAAAVDASERAAARRARPAGAKPPQLAGEALAAAHAIALGLSACVLASPYDCPPWLPPLVGALAGAARSPAAAVRATVEATFADFKRTHADTWDATRAAFGEDAWAAAADGLALSPSYFC